MATLSYVFDACAIVAYLRRETGCDVVMDLLAQHPDGYAMHAVNVCEVYYDSLRVGGAAIAADIFEILGKLGLVFRRDLDDVFLQEVGQLKVAYRISLADAFAVALARRLGATLVSSDHHEFDPLAQAGACHILFIR